jgi:hypothetical protein
MRHPLRVAGSTTVSDTAEPGPVAISVEMDHLRFCTEGYIERVAQRNIP